tara:strand:- start:1474 stop:1719 length:246 start_codon:yes stop_codon:yes gene_type:complete
MSLNASQPIILDDGTMTQAFRTWALQATLSIPIVGAGSPEAVVTAPQYSLYLDSTGVAGSVAYRKMLPSIGGDKSQGWILT